jgi:two-component system, LytTR family, sensor kinase
VVRFGREKLQIVKEIGEETMEAFVPSMLLQPIVENSLKHGLSSKLEGGEITIRTAMRDGRLIVEVEDNGVGISETRMPQVYVDGIGISNVHERLRVLYGNDFKMEITSREGEGTRIRIEVPEVVPTLGVPY